MSCFNGFKHPHHLLLIFWIIPLHSWFVIHAENEEGKKLKKVLPQQERDKEGDVAYIDLTLFTGMVYVTDALEFVEQILAETSIEAWIRAALINVFFTPVGFKEDQY